MQVNSGEKLVHALLYSITVDLPAHRVGQLDSVIVLASPINDINLHAWDLNRVQRFLRLDIGIRVELCTKCLRQNQEASITFIMEKMFIKDCIEFLCRRAHIYEGPVTENSFLVYNVSHQCFYNTPPDDKAPPLPPPYSESTPPPTTPTSPPEHDYDMAEFVEAPPSAPPLPEDPSVAMSHLLPQKPTRPVFQFPDGVWGDYSSGSGPSSSKNQPPSPPPAVTGSGVESEWGAYTSEDLAHLPPRTIPRRNHATSIPAVHPYSNVVQPQIFDNNSARNFSLETPYQINSRIIFSDNGDVQYERNILGNVPNPHPPANTALLFMRSIPLPPSEQSEGCGRG